MHSLQTVLISSITFTFLPSHLNPLLSLMWSLEALCDKECLFAGFVQCLSQWNSCSGIQQCCCYNRRLCRDELLCFSYDKASHDVRDQAAMWAQSLIFPLFAGIVFPDRMGRLTKVEKGSKTQQEFTVWSKWSNNQVVEKEKKRYVFAHGLRHTALIFL